MADPQGLAVDRAGDLLVSDTNDNRVRLVAAASCSTGCAFGLTSIVKGDIYTIAGNGGYGFSGDSGPAGTAELAVPRGLAVDDAGDLLIADAGNNRVRLLAGWTCSSACPFGLSATTVGDIYTVAGTGTEGFSGDGGAAGAAALDGPIGVALDGAGNLLIADTANDRVREVTGGASAPTCVVTALRNPGPSGHAEQDVTVSDPYGLASVSAVEITNGKVYVGGSAGTRIDPTGTTLTGDPRSVVLTAVKTTAGTKTVWSFDATSATGVTTRCV
jgi:hypothetical protein